MYSYICVGKCRMYTIGLHINVILLMILQCNIEILHINVMPQFTIMSHITVISHITVTLHIIVTLHITVITHISVMSHITENFI